LRLPDFSGVAVSWVLAVVVSEVALVHLSQKGHLSATPSDYGEAARTGDQP
jgi:hypothetical protein